MLYWVSYLRHAGLRTISGGSWLGFICFESLRRQLLLPGYHLIVFSLLDERVKLVLSHLISFILFFLRNVKLNLFYNSQNIDMEGGPLNLRIEKRFYLHLALKPALLWGCGCVGGGEEVGGDVKSQYIKKPDRNNCIFLSG